MFVDTKETSFLHDLTKPSLEALSHVLRHRELWPEGFVWDYLVCHSCAMGLAWTLWEQITEQNSTMMSKQFDMSLDAARNIFDGRNRWFDGYSLDTSLRAWRSVTPEMVADQIDKYLAEREA